MQHDVELRERIRDVGIRLEPAQRLALAIEYRVAIAEVEIGINSDTVDANGAAVANRRVFDERTGREREQVRRQRLCFSELEHRSRADSPLVLRRAIALAFATAVQSAGTVIVRVKRAFRSGWSKHGMASCARAGTKME